VRAGRGPAVLYSLAFFFVLEACRAARRPADARIHSSVPCPRDKKGHLYLPTRPPRTYTVPAPGAARVLSLSLARPESVSKGVGRRPMKGHPPPSRAAAGAASRLVVKVLVLVNVVALVVFLAATRSMQVRAESFRVFFFASC